jgi:hypothetical protein
VTTVGQLSTPDVPCGASFTQPQLGVASGNTYVVPFPGTITSWSFEDGATPVSQLKLKVFRPAGGNNYTITGEAAAGSQAANTVNTYQSQIPVAAGDLIGYHRNAGTCLTDTGNTADIIGIKGGDLAPGTVSAFSTSGTRQIPISATVRYCVVPNLLGLRLAPAMQALSAASCTLGTVRRPKNKRKRRKAKFVRSVNVAAGTAISDTAPIDLALGKKPKHR